MEEKNYLELKNINAYVISFHLSNYICNTVVKWEDFAKDTIGTVY